MSPIIMFIGGNHLQQPAINEARRRGLLVLVVDGRRDCAVASSVDYMECVSLTDLPSIERIARTYGIIGALTLEEDTLPAVCHINEMLKLPSQGTGIAQAVTDKAVMRQCLVNHQVSCPIFYKIETEDEYGSAADIIREGIQHKPYITKPSDRRGSIGTMKVESFDQFDAAVQYARKAARNGKILVEEFIEGEEYGAQGFSVDGEMAYCFVSHKTVSSNLRTIGHAFPAALPEHQEIAVREECRKALKCLGIKNGPSTIDIRVNQEGKPYILEVGARIGGTRLPQLIELYSGFDYLGMTISQSCGYKVTHARQHHLPTAGLLLHYDRPGTVKRVNSYSYLLNQYRPIDYRIKIKQGTRLSVDEYYGYVIFTGDNAKSAEKQCASFMQDVKKCIVV